MKNLKNTEVAADNGQKKNPGTAKQDSVPSRETASQPNPLNAKADYPYHHELDLDHSNRQLML